MVLCGGLSTAPGVAAVRVSHQRPPHGPEPGVAVSGAVALEPRPRRSGSVTARPRSPAASARARAGCRSVGSGGTGTAAAPVRVSHGSASVTSGLCTGQSRVSQCRERWHWNSGRAGPGQSRLGLGHQRPLHGPEPCVAVSGAVALESAQLGVTPALDAGQGVVQHLVGWTQPRTRTCGQRSAQLIQRQPALRTWRSINSRGARARWYFHCTAVGGGGG